MHNQEHHRDSKMVSIRNDFRLYCLGIEGVYFLVL